ncbi:unnamed protein product, partial [Bubo scandiacus]
PPPPPPRAAAAAAAADPSCCKGKESKSPSVDAARPALPEPALPCPALPAARNFPSPSSPGGLV